MIAELDIRYLESISAETSKKEDVWTEIKFGKNLALTIYGEPKDRIKFARLAQAINEAFSDDT